jgi:hypothetical protein
MRMLLKTLPFTGHVFLFAFQSFLSGKKEEELLLVPFTHFEPNVKNNIKISFI